MLVVDAGLVLVVSMLPPVLLVCVGPDVVGTVVARVVVR